MARVHPHKGRGAGAAVEVFVAAADGEVGLRALQVHRHGASAVGQVPDGERTRHVGGGGGGMHVEHGAGAVVHMRQHQHSHAAGMGVGQGGGDVLGVHQPQLQALRGAQALGDVEVGGEVGALGKHHAAASVVLFRHGDGGVQHLVEIDRGAVGDHHLALARAHQRGNAVAQALGQVEPAGAVPTADQVAAPFAGNHVGHAGGGGAGHGTQRIAIQVDHALGQGEMFAQRAQRICGVKRLAVLQGGHGSWFTGFAKWHARGMHRPASA